MLLKAISSAPFDFSAPAVGCCMAVPSLSHLSNVVCTLVPSGRLSALALPHSQPWLSRAPKNFASVWMSVVLIPVAEVTAVSLGKM